MAKRPPTAETKERASRISPDYYKRRDPLQHWKRILALLLALGGIAWLGLSFLRSGNEPFSPGPLSWSHAAWDQQCSACHVQFVAIRGDALTAGAASKQTMDQQCQQCHAASVHHHGQKPDVACSTCHIEHQGREHLVARVSDHACTECHADLKSHAASATQFENVSDYAHHPQTARSLKSPDPGKLKFSHSRHLLPGLTFGAPDKTALGLDDLPKALRGHYERYAGKGGELTLDCAACHRLSEAEAAPASDTQTPVHADKPGAYMLPVEYESHCQACHPLTLEPPQRPFSEPGSRELIPHRLSGAQMERLAAGLAASQALDGRPGDAPAPPSPRLPNKPGDPPAADSASVRKDSVEHSGRVVRSACIRCHDFRSKDGSEQFPDVEPVNVPAAWLKHAWFDHSAHRAVACLDCHTGTSLSGKLPAQLADLDAALDKEKLEEIARLVPDNAQVLIPGFGKCVECHAPRTVQAGKTQGGARFDCVECHRYHPHGAPTGGAETSTAGGLSIDKFLSGEAAAQ